MALPTSYSQEFKKFTEFFGKIRDAQAPDKFTQSLLLDWGYKSTNHRAFIPILKSLGFLTTEGVPTSRYNDYRNHALSKKIMGEAIKEAYSDIFLIKEKPTNADKDLIEGKFKSFHNATDTVANLMTKTFYGLLELADLDSISSDKEKSKTHEKESTSPFINEEKKGKKENSNIGLHYNIQIHLPATKDTEVYNAIFKSLKEHLLEE